MSNQNWGDSRIEYRAVCFYSRVATLRCRPRYWHRLVTLSYEVNMKLTRSDMDNPDALRNYYELLAAMLRVIVSAVFSRGVHNEQIMEQTRAFLAENRSSMVGIFKRSAKIGGEVSSDNRKVIQNLVKAYVALITAAGFVEVRSYLMSIDTIR